VVSSSLTVMTPRSFGNARYRGARFQTETLPREDDYGFASCLIELPLKEDVQAAASEAA
jgi:hypothetical protein